MTNDRPCVAVVGGGLAGLTAGALLAQGGAEVTVFEAAGQLGGRARTMVREGFHFNLGAHALYRTGAGARVRRRLGVAVTGGRIRPGALKLASGSTFSRLTSAGGSLLDRTEALRVLARVGREDPAALRDLTVAEWLDAHVRRPGARRFLEAGFRVTTYSAEQGRLAADAALSQLALGLRGSVRYLDGGWQRLVEAVRVAAERAGATVVAGERVVRVEHDDRVRGIRLASGLEVPVDGAVLAVGGPREARALIDGPAAAALARWHAEAVPVRAACLDLALSRLPDPATPYVLGLDEPTYMAVHSIYGDLAPPGGALIHTAWYLSGSPPAVAASGDALTPEGDVPERSRERLEALLDLAQPGWRAHIVHERFLPHLDVAYALPTPATGGLAGRPGPQIPGVEGLFVAGDWVGGEGLLADASFASAEHAADALLAGLRRAPTAGIIEAQ